MLRVVPKRGTLADLLESFHQLPVLTDQQAVIIRFGTQEVYPARLDDDDLAALSAYMRGPDVLIHVSLATGGTATATVWGCDLTDGYVRINADYTT